MESEARDSGVLAMEFQDGHAEIDRLKQVKQL
jgi:hypothetical protein